MKHKLPLTDAWPRIKKSDWQKPEFSLDKAYACALFAELAYRRIADFELENANRVNVVPCFAYQEIVRSGTAFDFDAFVRQADFVDFFTVLRRYAVVVGVRTPNVIFVSIRGTKYLYDWLVNVNAQKSCIGRSENSVCFHRGFFRAISECFEPVSQELQKFLQQQELPIYVTGHSLGGALAAILHALWDRAISIEHSPLNNGHRVPTDSCFTFGMPRYGDRKAIHELRQPYHLYNDKDIVPTVPPRFLGFEHCLTEYRLDGKEIEREPDRVGLSFGSWIYRLALDKGISHHAMELYRERIKKYLDRSP